MAEITAALVNELRARTGQPMMACKKKLVETGGDIDAAEKKFRAEGVKTSVLERAATEGRVFSAVSKDNKVGAIVEINCNTDFTAKSDAVAAVGEKALAKLLSGTAADALAADADIKNAFVAISQQTGENVQLGRVKTVHAEHVGSYLYSTAGKGKTAVLMGFTGGGNEEVARLTGMHIVASKPLSLDRAGMPADLIAREKEIAVEQAKSTGKPQNIAEKIAEGKLNAFYAEKVLLDQEYINAEAHKGNVASLLKSKGATLSQFVRVEVGAA